MAMPHPSAKKIRPAAGPNGEGGGDSFSGSTAEEKVTPVRGRMPTLEDPVPDITEAEYRNLKALMDVFCRVPLLAEFSRPVSLLHPEVSCSFGHPPQSFCGSHRAHTPARNSLSTFLMHNFIWN